ncbi:hypothetical protein AGIG_G18915 [Arapaima gigas]
MRRSWTFSLDLLPSGTATRADLLSSRRRRAAQHSPLQFSSSPGGDCSACGEDSAESYGASCWQLPASLSPPSPAPRVSHPQLFRTLPSCRFTFCPHLLPLTAFPQRPQKREVWWPCSFREVSVSEGVRGQLLPLLLTFSPVSVSLMTLLQSMTAKH